MPIHADERAAIRQAFSWISVLMTKCVCCSGLIQFNHILLIFHISVSYLEQTV